MARDINDGGTDTYGNKNGPGYNSINRKEKEKVTEDISDDNEGSSINNQFIVYYIAVKGVDMTISTLTTHSNIKEKR